MQIYELWNSLDRIISHYFSLLLCLRASTSAEAHEALFILESTGKLLLNYQRIYSFIFYEKNVRMQCCLYDDLGSSHQCYPFKNNFLYEKNVIPYMQSSSVKLHVIEKRTLFYWGLMSVFISWCQLEAGSKGT